MKKIIKQLFILGALIALLPIVAVAQNTDSRQRNIETVVADGLAQLPAADVEVFERVMSELAATGFRGVQMIAAMLRPADKGANAAFEYALSGIVAYVTQPGQEVFQADVRKGLLLSLERCTDYPNRAFLLSLLQLCANAGFADLMADYLYNPYLSDYAVRVLISTPGTDQLLLTVAGRNHLTMEHKRALAYAFGEKEMAEAESVLLTWLQGADADLAATIYNSLAVCGSRVSLKPLLEAAARNQYAFDNLGATDAYLRLIEKLAKTGDPKDAKAAEKAAKALLKCDQQPVRGGALAVLVDLLGVKKAMPYIISAVKDGPAEYRYAALQTLTRDDDKAFAQVTAGMPRYSIGAQAAVIARLGECGIASQIDVITLAVASSDPHVAKTAIEALGLIGGQKVADEIVHQKTLATLIEALQGPHRDDATQALLAFNGSIDAEVERLLEMNHSAVLVPALELAAARRITATTDRVFALLAHPDEQIRNAAYSALPYVVGTQHIDRLAGLLDSPDEQHTAQLQTALIRTTSQLPAGELYDTIARYVQASPMPAHYYPVLAHSGTHKAIEGLLAGFDGGDEAAFTALLTVENAEMIGVLYRIAAENPALADPALNRFAYLVAKEPMAPTHRYEYYRQGLELKPSVPVRKKLLGYLSDVHTLPALMLAADYLSDEEVAEPAAHAVKTIVAKSTPMPGGDTVRSILEQAREVYRQKLLTVTDAGYAVDEITELLGKLPEPHVFEMSPEESAQGFEILFDGQTLDNWTGNKVNYVAVNGVIDVTASYGGSGNLYTTKQYSDFDLRFEFRFLREGVNNGIGIRTPMGVDAAYHGMEIQILDHDAPIYKNLKVYQQHGSVYGIIPAQRVVFGELGRWNTMQIKAVGDRIVVTVNDRVILDGNIREACQGHNVSPDGSKTNPFTVDGKNHPGLFNKSGHIGLLGHGEGIQFRNLRILDLSPKGRRK